MRLKLCPGQASQPRCICLRPDAAQVPFAEDQHPAGDFGAGDEHEPLRVVVCLVRLALALVLAVAFVFAVALVFAGRRESSGHDGYAAGSHPAAH